jgi:hypothetical protein
MDNEQPINNEETTGDSWEEIGGQFRELGESLAAAFRSAWQDEANRERMQQMRTGLEAMVEEVSGAIHDGASTPEAQQIKDEMKKVASTLRETGEEKVQEVRPHLLSALRQVNEHLQTIIGKDEEEL